jgi:hypothetical protein
MASHTAVYRCTIYTAFYKDGLPVAVKLVRIYCSYTTEVNAYYTYASKMVCARRYAVLHNVICFEQELTVQRVA